MNIFFQKLKDNLLAVVPITLIVILLNFTLTPLDLPLLIRFLVGSVFIVLGLSFFLIGVDIGITPLGSRTGDSLARSNKLWLVVAAGLILGFFISLAEPGLTVLADQVNMVTSGQIPGVLLLIVVSIGMAVFVALGFLRVFFNFQLYKILFFGYLTIFVMAIFTTPMFLGIAFDASGATTGILAVPFILALSVGISALRKGNEASEKDSFGLVALASAGAIMSVMILNLFMGHTEFSGDLSVGNEVSSGIMGVFGAILPGIALDGFITLLPLLVILVLMQYISFKASKRAFKKMLMGFLYAYLGLVLFYLGVDGGFMDVGTMLGYQLAALDNQVFVVVVGFVIGLVTILAEPAVYVLTHQIEEVTSGYVKRRTVLIPLCIGVGLAVALSIIRIIVPSVQLWHYLLPGYIIAVGMMFFVPKLFVGIAFDAGGVATGPMTATFILAFTQGAAAQSETANILTDGFGMISMVAMFPIITLQALGFIFRVQERKARRSNGTETRK